MLRNLKSQPAGPDSTIFMFQFAEHTKIYNQAQGKKSAPQKNMPHQNFSWTPNYSQHPW